MSKSGATLALWGCATGRSGSGGDDDDIGDDDDLGDDDIDDDDGGCAYHSECDDDQFCWNGECEDVIGRNYSLWIGSGWVDEENASGEAWDFPGGLPDPFIQVYWEDGATILATATDQDTLSPSWNDTENVVLQSGGTFCIGMWDEDLSDHDHIDGTCWPGNDALVAIVRASTDGGTFGDPLYEGYAGVAAALDPNF